MNGLKLNLGNSGDIFTPFKIPHPCLGGGGERGRGNLNKIANVEDICKHALTGGGGGLWGVLPLNQCLKLNLGHSAGIITNFKVPQSQKS